MKIAPHKPPRSMLAVSELACTYYGGVVKSFPDGEGKEEGKRGGLGMTGRPADYRKNTMI